ncbi:hypothetical protein Q8A67_024040 [Cirrhinus molitorella]|uniref:phosphatidate cytidylyltransferase n=1 Tax=Cirrhinus molitorella TaxID=172907 RepID=A0AA88P743_9TELE|nr:hypothetical protein Q8A67_024040 [Cirrhinus molitorella]
MLFTLLGVVALIQRERSKDSNTHSGQDEKVDQRDVSPLRSSDASTSQTSQHVTTDPAVLLTADEPFTTHPDNLSDESVIQDLVWDLSEQSADVPTTEEPFTGHPEVDEYWTYKSEIQYLFRELSEWDADVLSSFEKYDVDSFQNVPVLSADVSTTEELITGQPEVDLVNIPQASESSTEDDTVAPQSSQLKDNETTAINSCSYGIELNEGGTGTVHSEICMDEQVAMKFPSKKHIKFINLEEPQDHFSEDEETYGTSDVETKSDSEVPEVPVPADDTPEVFDKVLSGLSSRWKNWWLRGMLTLAMISGFFTSIYLGPMALMMMVLCIQFKCFHEITTVGYSVYHCYNLPWFRSLSWYFLLCVNYFFYGETLTDYFSTLVQREEPTRLLSQYHRFISFVLYLAGFCMFVLSLVKRHYRLQFYMFGWTHVALMILATQSQLIIRNLFEGMIWFILSPKKTWKGFIGGLLSTVVFGIILSYMMAGYPYFVCPVEFNNHSSSFTMDCEPSELFQLQDYDLPSVLQSITGWTTVTLYPFQIHSFALSSFASVMGPFGGFFASGFERAFRIKDFANTIPGHGGVLDRFDCQFLMATFVNVYIGSFIREPNPCKILQQILAFRPDQQLQIFNLIQAHLRERGLLPPLEEADYSYGLARLWGY